MPPTSAARRALVTGIAGQDGGYLAEQLLADGYAVFGLVRPEARRRAEALPWLHGVEVLEGDLRDTASIDRALADARPDELFNLASYSQPGRAWSEPEPSADVNALGFSLNEPTRMGRRPNPPTRNAPTEPNAVNPPTCQRIERANPRTRERSERGTRERANARTR